MSTPQETSVRLNICTSVATCGCWQWRVSPLGQVFLLEQQAALAAGRVHVRAGMYAGVGAWEGHTLCWMNGGGAWLVVDVVWRGYRCMHVAPLAGSVTSHRATPGTFVLHRLLLDGVMLCLEWRTLPSPTRASPTADMLGLHPLLNMPDNNMGCHMVVKHV